MIDCNTLMELGFDHNPLSGIHHTNDQIRANYAVRAAVTDKALLTVTARRGTGKTTAVNNAIQELVRQGIHPAIIQPNRVEVELLRAADLSIAAILDLSDEKPKAVREHRVRQLARILGTASAKRPVVMIIEEAHCLSYQPLLQIKRLRELSYNGVAPLFSVILIGQRNPMTSHRGLDEVRLRSISMELQGLSPQESSQLIDKMVGKVFEREAIQLASTTTGIWLDLLNILGGAMTHAVTMGRKMVTAEDVQIATNAVSPSGTNYHDLGAAAKALGITGDALSKMSGVSRTQTFHALAGGNVGPHTRQKLIDAIEKEKTSAKVA